MNRVVLTGRLTRDPEKRTTSGGVSVLDFTLAVDKRTKADDGSRQADFIDCVAWRNTADFITNYFTKGKPICVTGSLQVDSYETREGEKRNRLRVVVDDAEFLGPRNESRRDDVPAAAPAEPAKKDSDPLEDELKPFEPLGEDELPF